VPLADIFHFASFGNYTTITTTKGEKIVVSHNLGYFEDLVIDATPASQGRNLFFRIHKCHIVRLSAVRKFIKPADGDYVFLNNGEKVPVSQRLRASFLGGNEGGVFLKQSIHALVMGNGWVCFRENNVEKRGLY
jgi:DNA-binding LytR/AlgR family response regulator